MEKFDLPQSENIFTPFIQPLSFDSDLLNTDYNSVSDIADSLYQEKDLNNFNFAIDDINNRIESYSIDNRPSEEQDIINRLVVKPDVESRTRPTQLNFDIVNSDFDRARFNPKFKDLGFDPRIDNTSYYNENTTIWNDFRTLGKAILPFADKSVAGLGADDSSGFGERLAGESGNPFYMGFVGGYKSIGDLFSGRGLFSPDINQSMALSRAMELGGITRDGGVITDSSKFLANLLISFQSTLGMMANIVVESAAIAAATTAATGGAGAAPGAVAGAGRLVLGVGQTALGTAKAMRAAKAINTTSRLLANVNQVNNARKVFNAAKLGENIFTQAFPSAAQTIKTIKTLESSGDILKAEALRKTLFLNYAFDIKAKFNAINEGQTLFYDSYNNVVAAGLGELLKTKTLEDITEEELAAIKTNAQRSGTTTMILNSVIAGISNQIVFSDMLKGQNKFLREVFEESRPDFLKNIVKGKDVFVKGVKQKDIYVRLKGGLLPLSDIKAIGFKRWASRGGIGVLRYAAANLSEGIEEVTQEAIVSGVSEYYTGILRDPKVKRIDLIKASLENSRKSVFSQQGFENFLGGFLMGGYSNVLTALNNSAQKLSFKLSDPKAYAEYQKRQEELFEKVQEIGNRIQDDPYSIVEPSIEKFSNVTSASVDREQAILRSDILAFQDAKLDQRAADLIFMTKHGMSDLYIDQLKDLLNLTDDEIQQFVNTAPETNSVEKVKERINKRISQIESAKKLYDESQTIIVNPYNPRKFTPGTKEFTQEKLKYEAVEMGRTLYMLSHETFKDAAERMQSIQNDLQTLAAEIEANETGQAGIGTISNTDLAVLTNESAMSARVRTLDLETKALELVENPTQEQKDTIKKNKNIIKTLQDYQALLIQYQAIMETDGAKVEESLKKKLADGLKGYIQAILGKEVKVTPTTGANQSSSALDKMLNMVLDHAVLDKRTKIYQNSIAMFNDIKGFMSIFDNLYDTIRNLVEKKKSIFLENIKDIELQERQKKLIDTLVALGIIPDVAEIEAFVQTNDTNELKTFWREGIIIAEGSADYNFIQQIFNNYNNLDSQVAGQDVEVVEQTEDSTPDDDPESDDAFDEPIQQLIDKLIDGKSSNANYKYLFDVIVRAYNIYKANLKPGDTALVVSDWLQNEKLGGGALRVLMDSYDVYTTTSNPQILTDSTSFRNWLYDAYRNGDTVTAEFNKYGITEDILTLGTQNTTNVNVVVHQTQFFVVIKNIGSDPNTGAKFDVYTVVYKDTLAPVEKDLIQSVPNITEVTTQSLDDAIAIANALNAAKQAALISETITLADGTVIKRGDYVRSKNGLLYIFIKLDNNNVVLRPVDSSGVILDQLVDVIRPEFVKGFTKVDNTTIVPSKPKVGKKIKANQKLIFPFVNQISFFPFGNNKDEKAAQKMMEILIGNSDLDDSDFEIQIVKRTPGQSTAYSNNPHIDFNRLQEYSLVLKVKINNPSTQAKLQAIKELAGKQGLVLPPDFINSGSVGILAYDKFQFRDENGNIVDLSKLSDTFIKNNILKGVNGKEPTPNDIARFRHEVAVSNFLKHNAVRVASSAGFTPVVVTPNLLGISIKKTTGSFTYRTKNDLPKYIPTEKLWYPYFDDYIVILDNIFDEQGNISTEYIISRRDGVPMQDPEIRAVKAMIKDVVRKQSKGSASGRYVLITKTPSGEITYAQLKSQELEETNLADVHKQLEAGSRNLALLSDPVALKKFNEDLNKRFYISYRPGYSVQLRLNPSGKVVVSVKEDGGSIKYSSEFALASDANGLKDQLLNDKSIQTFLKNEFGQEVSLIMRNFIDKEASAASILENTEANLQPEVRKSTAVVVLNPNSQAEFEAFSQVTSAPTPPTAPPAPPAPPTPPVQSSTPPVQSSTPPAVPPTPPTPPSTPPTPPSTPPTPPSTPPTPPSTPPTSRIPGSEKNKLTNEEKLGFHKKFKEVVDSIKNNKPDPDSNPDDAIQDLENSNPDLFENFMKSKGYYKTMPDDSDLVELKNWLSARASYKKHILNKMGLSKKQKESKSLQADLDKIEEIKRDPRIKFKLSDDPNHTQPESLETFLDWVNRNLPSFITVEQKNHIRKRLEGNPAVLGYFVASLEKVGDGVNVGGRIVTTPNNFAAYHEAFHAVFDLLLTDKERKEYRASMKKYLIDKHGREGYNQMVQNFFKANPAYKNSEDNFLEEQMADEFAKFKVNPKSAKAPSLIKSWFNRLMHWIKTVLNKFRKYDFQNLFESIDSGKFSNAGPVVNERVKETLGGIVTESYKLLAYKEYTVDGRTYQAHLDPADNDKLVKIAAYMYRKTAEEDVSLSHEEILEQVSDFLFENYDPFNYEIDSLEYIKAQQIQAAIDFEGRKQFIEAVEEYIDLFDLQEQATEEYQEEAVDTLGARGEYAYGESADERGGFKSISKKLKMFIADTFVLEEDPFFDITLDDWSKVRVPVDADYVYNGLMLAGSNTFNDVDLLKNMYYFTRNSFHSRAVFEKFLSETGVDIDYVLANNAINSPIRNSNLFQQFVQQFRNNRIEYNTKYYGKDGITNISSSTKEGVDAQLTYWYNKHGEKVSLSVASRETATKNRIDFDLAQDTYIEALEYISKFTDKNLTEDQIAEINEELINYSNLISELLFDSTGIQVSPNYILGSIAIENNSRINSGLSFVSTNMLDVMGNAADYTGHPILLNTFNRIKFAIFVNRVDSSGSRYDLMRNVFDPEIGNRLLLTELALGNMAFDERAVHSVFTSPDKKSIYPHQKQTLHFEKVAQMNDEGYVERKQQEDSFFNKHFLLNSPIFRRMSQLKMFRVVRSAGHAYTKQTTSNHTSDSKLNFNKGVAYGDYNTRQYLSSLISDYFSQYKVNRKGEDKLKVIRVTDENNNTYVRALIPVSIAQMEASNRMDQIELPVFKAINANPNYQDGMKNVNAFEINDMTVLLFKNEIEREYNVIKDNYERVNNGTVNPILGYNVDNDGNFVGKGYHFFKMQVLMGDDIRDFLEAKAKEGKSFEEAVQELNQQDDLKNSSLRNFDNYIKASLLEDFRNFYLQEASEYLLDMTLFGTDGVIREDVDDRLRKGYGQDANSNTLLNITPGNTPANLAQIYFNDWINTLAVNQLILGEEAKMFKEPFVDPIKRGKMRNAAGPSAQTLITDPTLGINHTMGNESIVMVAITDEEFDQAYGIQKGKGERNDGQIIITPKAARYFAFAFGSLDSSQAALMDKIDAGEPVTTDEFFDNFLPNKSILNPQKLVYAGGDTEVAAKTFLKMSSVTYTLEDASYINENGERVPYPGMERKFHLIQNMEAIQNAPGNEEKVVIVVPLSAAKTIKQNVIPYEDISSPNFDPESIEYTFLDAKGMKLQMVNPSNKTSITVPNQTKLLITSEQNPNAQVEHRGNTVKIKDIIDRYHEVLGKNILNEYATRLGLIFSDLNNLDVELANKTLSEQGINVSLSDFLKYAKQNLKTAKSSSLELELFSGENGVSNYELNTPYTMKNFSSFMMSYLAKKALKEKTEGLTLTLKTDSYERVYRMVYSLDSNGKIDKQRVIRKADYKKANVGEPVVYDEKTNTVYNADGSTSTLAEAVAKGPVFIIDRLRVDLPEYKKVSDNPNTWVKTGKKYAESIIPPHHKELAKWLEKNLGVDLPDSIAELFAIRIPSQDKHSSIAVKVVDFAPVYYGSTVVFPYDLIQISGADFDIDKVYAQIKKWYTKNGEFRVFGEGRNDNERYYDYIMYQAMELRKKSSLLRAALNNYYESPKLYEQKVSSRKNLNGNIVPKSEMSENKKEQLEIALSVLGLPISFEEYKEFVKKNGIEPYKAANDNELLDSRISLQSNSHMTEALPNRQDPISYEPADTKAMERELSFMKKMFPRIAKITSTVGFAIDNLRGKAKSYLNTKENSNMIGVPVSLNSVINTLREFGIKLNPFFGSIRLNGKYYDDFGKTLTEVEEIDISKTTYNSVPYSQTNSSRDLVISLNSLDRDSQLNPDNIKLPGYENVPYSDVASSLSETELIDLWVQYLDANEELKEALLVYGSIGVLTDSYANSISDTLVKALNKISSERGISTTADPVLERVQYLISNKITAATDDAKLRLLSGLGLNKYEMKLATVMVGLGIPLKTTILFVNTSVVKEAGESGNALSYIRNKRKELFGATSSPDGITSKKMIYNILNFKNANPSPDYEKRKAQIELDILDELEKIDSIATFAGKMITLNGMTRGIEDFQNILDIKEAISDLRLDKTGLAKNLKYKGKPIPFDVRHIFNYSKLESGDNPHWLAYYLDVFRHFDNQVLPNLFTVKTKAFEFVQSNLSKSLSLNPESSVKLSNDLLSYFIIRTYMNNLGKQGEGRRLSSLSNSFIYEDDYTYSSRTIENTVADIKAYLTVNNLSNHFIDNYIEDRSEIDNNTKVSFSAIQSNSFVRLSSNEKQRIQNAFAALFNDPNTREFAIEILHYMLVKDGFQYSYGTLLPGLPSEILKPIYEAASQVFEAFKKAGDPVNPDYSHLNDVLGFDFSIALSEINLNYPLSAGRRGYIAFESVPTELENNEWRYVYDKKFDKDGNLIYTTKQATKKGDNMHEFPLYMKVQLGVGDVRTFRLKDFEPTDKITSYSQAVANGGVESSRAVYELVENDSHGYFKQNPIGFIYSIEPKLAQSLNDILDKRFPSHNFYYLERKSNSNLSSGPAPIQSTLSSGNLGSANQLSNPTLNRPGKATLTPPSQGSGTPAASGVSVGSNVPPSSSGSTGTMSEEELRSLYQNAISNSTIPNVNPGGASPTVYNFPDGFSIDTSNPLTTEKNKSDVINTYEKNYKTKMTWEDFLNKFTDSQNCYRR